MSAQNDGGPAFPLMDVSQNTATGETVSHQYCYTGMTLRDYFAAMAMSGALGGTPGPHLFPARLAAESYAHADAMLAAREAKP